MREEFLWTEKYRPTKVADVALPEYIKKQFQDFVATGEVPNLLLAGSSGVGKTTIALAMLEELGYEYIIINGSLRGNIDTLRTEVSDFASSVSMNGKRKFVVLDEADYLNQQSFMPALRNFIETFSTNCGFILTANYPNRIMKELRSRLVQIDFKFDQVSKKAVASSILKRCSFILNNEGVEFDKAVLIDLILKHYPDFRKVISDLQRYSTNGGKIDKGILVSLIDGSLTKLIGDLKKKDFSSIRKWVGDNPDMEDNDLFAAIYDVAEEFMDPPNLAQLILIVAKYQYQAAFVASREINTVACLTEIMINCEWKE